MTQRGSELRRKNLSPWKSKSGTGSYLSSGDYKFSSYNAKTWKKKLTWLDHDPAYLALGKTDDARQTAYQRWFQESIPNAEWELIREAVKRNWAFGNSRFKEE